jgi:hypothetical protein
MFVLGWLLQGLIVLIAAYYVYRMGLSVAILRAVMAGDDERAQRLRDREDRSRTRSVLLQLSFLGLLGLVSLVVVVYLVGKL